MELLAGDRRNLVTDDVDPLVGSEIGCGWIRARPEGSNGGLITLADLAPPPRKLRPIRYGDRLPSEDQHPLDVLAGTLDQLPELGCFDAPLGAKIVDVEKRGDLARGFAKDHPGGVGSGTRFGTGTACDGASLSSSVDSDGGSGGIQAAATIGKRKRKTREKLQHFLEKLVGNMLKRQEKMNEQLMEVIETKERERILREEAWKQQEMERMKRGEEVIAQEMARGSAIISLIQTVIGQETEIPRPQPQNLPEQTPKLCDLNSSRRWPRAEMQALITIRSEVEEKVGKGSIWDEISERMREKGYKRSAKKCKEKWENMNKYYRKVMEEGGRKRAEHSKTCCYFQELDSLYNKTAGDLV
ncbi:PREDICTED: trihelix transcription factor GT-2 [Tarenaya hassleriana]|uniref:trihelix transcription factor GT-2 n=1 Tax=Tarenaya hassleriana TaxID=28532 RepID=UPI00053C2106|nr:PREDICTED: trihelix transcription factor GT-2 [Tarenaya hassleriana]